jgi:PIN domain nuclease of toxin-antitoxin system
VKLLLDTHLLLWAAQGNARLPKSVVALIEDEENELYFSAASIWETATKSNLGRSDFTVDPRRFRQHLLDNTYIELPILGEHALRIAGLPLIHKDPFDRILVAQAMVEDYLLVTSDPVVAKYSGSIRLV